MAEAQRGWERILERQGAARVKRGRERRRGCGAGPKTTHCRLVLQRRPGGVRRRGGGGLGIGRVRRRGGGRAGPARKGGLAGHSVAARARARASAKTLTRRRAKHACARAQNARAWPTAGPAPQTRVRPSRRGRAVKTRAGPGPAAGLPFAAV